MEGLISCISEYHLQGQRNIKAKRQSECSNRENDSLKISESQVPFALKYAALMIQNYLIHPSHLQIPLSLSRRREFTTLEFMPPLLIILTTRIVAVGHAGINNLVTNFHPHV